MTICDSQFVIFQLVSVSHICFQVDMGTQWNKILLSSGQKKKTQGMDLRDLSQVICQDGCPATYLSQVICQNGCLATTVGLLTTAQPYFDFRPLGF